VEARKAHDMQIPYFHKLYMMSVLNEWLSAKNTNNFLTCGRYAISGCSVRQCRKYKV
jgi:hypothetical protein